MYDGLANQSNRSNLAGNACAPKIPEVVGAVESLERSIEKLESYLQNFTSRVEAVCNGSQHEEQKLSTCSPIDSCPLSAKIKNQSNRIECMNNLIERYNNALEI